MEWTRRRAACFVWQPRVMAPQGLKHHRDELSAGKNHQPVMAPQGLKHHRDEPSARKNHQPAAHTDQPRHRHPSARKRRGDRRRLKMRSLSVCSCRPCRWMRNPTPKIRGNTYWWPRYQAETTRNRWRARQVECLNCRGGAGRGQGGGVRRIGSGIVQDSPEVPACIHQ